MTTSMPDREPEKFKSGFALMFTDRDKAVVFIEMLHIAHEVVTSPMSKVFGGGMPPEFEKQMLEIIRDVNDKFHEQGWCEDMNCSWENHKHNE